MSITCIQAIIRVLLLAGPLAFLPSVEAQTNFTLLRSFTGNTFGELSARVPTCALILGSDGALYGTSAGGGISNRGTVFKLNRDGSDLKILKSFLKTDGRMPSVGVVEGFDGALYGTTFAGGISNHGTIYKLNKDGGNFSVLHHFQAGADGDFPRAALVLGTNGALYGITQSGGISNSGTIFRLNSDGSGYGVLHSFVSSNGFFPTGRLLASGGQLYGTTTSGNSTNGGTVFKITENGSGYTVLHLFHFDTGEGTSPGAGLLEGSDGMLYGSTGSGGTNDDGTIFKLNKDGSGFATLLHFDSNNTNGGPRSPWELVEGDDGALYGSTPGGGITNRGTCFKLDKSGSAFQVLRKFLGTGGDGFGPQGSLLKGSNGVFYGTTFTGGEHNQGTVFALSTEPLPSRVLSLSASGSNVVQFAATSAFSYDVQRSTNLVSWTVLNTTNAPFTGRFSHTDFNPPSAAAFYRLKLY